MFTKSRPNIRAMRALAFLCVISLSLAALPSVQSGNGTSAVLSTGDTKIREERQTDAPADESAAATRAQESYGKLGLSFEANHGQTDEQVRFLARGSGYTLFLTATDAVFALQNSNCESRNEDHSLRSLKTNALNSEANPQSAICTPQSTVLRMKVEGANSEAVSSGVERLPGIVNYFIGNDSEKWHTDIPTFARVRYSETYPGVDLVYYGNQMQLEYDFVVRPGADSRQVALSFEGADSVAVEATTGDLLLKVGKQTITQHKPVVYQEVEGLRQPVESAYEMKGAGRVGFHIGAYDRAKPLVIDPVLVYSTYLAGSRIDEGRGIAVDSAGNAYVTGKTESTNFPTANPIQSANGGGSDAFVTKINAAGSALLYSTYLGGSGGSFTSPGDLGLGIAVDSSGKAYVTGNTTSTDFPTVNPIQTDQTGADAFVTKLNAAGSALLYSTYLGGNGADQGAGIAVASAGTAYVAGSTSSTDFLMVNPIQSANGGGGSDAFVTKINAAGSALLYSTYLGGDFGDVGNGIAVDSAGNAYVTGKTESTNFPTANPIQAANGGGTDAIVTKINAAGSALL